MLREALLTVCRKGNHPTGNRESTCMKFFRSIMSDRWRGKIIPSLFIGPLLIGAMGLAACAPKFGKHPEGAYLERIEYSPNYSDGAFRNQIDTPQFAPGTTMFSALFGSAFTKKIRPAPLSPVPSVKTDLKTLDKNRDTVVWLGHSSFYLILGGKRILIDPVFSHYAAPFASFNHAFAGTNVYTAEDMPEIDYLLITHDHWDHLDYPTVTALAHKVRYAVTGLGVGAHLRHWGYAGEKIHEGDWYDTIAPETDFTIHVLPARHFSGRFLTRNKTLWSGFALKTPARQILISGDSGYGPHFAEIAARFGGFDLAILENGQYDPRWPYIHMAPEETARAAVDLKAKALLPDHSGKFSMASHPWDEPLKRLTAASLDKPYRLLTPVIGDPVFLDDEKQVFPAWWQGME